MVEMDLIEAKFFITFLNCRKRGANNQKILFWPRPKTKLNSKKKFFFSYWPRANKPEFTVT